MPRLCEVYPGICLTTEEKARKTLSQNTYCFSTATMVVRTRVSVTSYVGCMSCLRLISILGRSAKSQDGWRTSDIACWVSYAQTKGEDRHNHPCQCRPRGLSFNYHTDPPNTAGNRTSKCGKLKMFKQRYWSHTSRKLYSHAHHVCTAIHLKQHTNTGAF